MKRARANMSVNKKKKLIFNDLFTIIFPVWFVFVLLTFSIENERKTNGFFSLCIHVLFVVVVV